MSRWVDDDDASLDVIIDGVTRKWLARKDDDPEMIDGPDGFWNRYANRVEFALPETGNELRSELCAPRGGSFDADDYYYRAWALHVAELRRSVEAGGRA